MNQVQMFYPYNDSFHEYGPPRAGMKRAQDFCSAQNQYKGGHWIVHTEQQHNEWWERKGKHLENLKAIGIGNWCLTSGLSIGPDAGKIYRDRMSI